MGVRDFSNFRLYLLTVCKTSFGSGLFARRRYARRRLVLYCLQRRRLVLDYLCVVRMLLRRHNIKYDELVK